MKHLRRCMALSGSAALAAASVLSCGAVPAAATSQDAQIVYDAVENLALETFTDRGLTAEEIAVLSAQAGLAYWYAWVTDASTWTTGNARIYSGFANYGSTVYFGSGAINDTASTIYAHVSDSSNNHISASYTLNNQSLLPRTQLYPSQYVGFGVSGGWGYTLSTSSQYEMTQNYDGLWSNDPFSGWLCVGSSPTLQSAVVYNSGNNRGFRFYSGGYDLPGNQYTVSGDFLEDFETLQEDLRETYPDVDPGFFVNIYIIEDPTEETGGCNCNHEITVNVDVTVEGSTYPSGWLDEVVPPSETVETLPVLEDYTLPTFELDNTAIDGMHFWRDLLDAIVTRSGLVGTVTVVLILSIVEWLLWNVGR